MYKTVISKVILVQIELLDELDRIAKKYDIKYQLFAGTLLGAVRHKGFIPWDDDLDVVMLREDYERFISACQKELGTDYFLQTPDLDGTPFPFTKLRKNNTLYVEGIVKNHDIHHGVFIDVFPLDNVFLERKYSKPFQKKLNRLFRIRSAKLQKGSKGVRGVLIFLVNLFFRKPIHFYSFKIDVLAQKFRNHNTDYAAHLNCGKLGKDYGGWYYRKDDFDNTQLFEFEGKLYPGPKRFHDLLTLEYGDYMTPPPIEKQVPHHGINKIMIDNEYFKIYKKNNEMIAERIFKSNEKH